MVILICNIIECEYTIISSTGTEDDLITAARLLSMSKRGNPLKTQVEEQGLDGRFSVASGWEPMSDAGVFPNFPQLDDAQLRALTVGVYQLKMAPSYVQEHLDNGHFQIFVSQQRPGLLCAKIQSRHSAASKYKLWVEFGNSAVTGWYCKCKSGARVVGMCAHITAVVWYMSYQRYHSATHGVRNWGTTLTDVAEQ